MSLLITVDADVQAAGRQIQDFSKQSRIALTSLSLVAQDLPFGFIGIQNNLPGVIQSFGALRAETGSVGGALKELGKGLIGPAGIFLAFSAVTSAVTFAIQKYGSLGEAFNALIGVLPKVTEQQKLFNSESAKAAGNVVVEEEKIKIFSKTLNDLEQPLKNRLAAYDALKKISPDLVASIDRENISSKESIEIINKQVESRLKLLQLKIQEAGVTAVLTKNAEQLAIKQQELTVADQDYVKASKALVDAQNNQVVFGPALTALQNNAQSEFKKTSEKTIELRNEILNLTKTEEDFLKQLAPIANSTAAINSETTTLTENYKKLAQSIKDAEKASIGQITQGIGGVGTILQDDAKVAKAFSASRRIINKSIKDSIQLRRKEFLKAPVKPVGAAPSGLSVDKIQQIQDEVSKIGELARIEDKILKVRSTLEDGFFKPLQESFTNFLTTGKFTFKEFGKTVLDSVARIVAKLAASGITKLLANLLAPGIGGVIAGTELSQATQGGSFITNLLGNLFGGVKSPSFGGVNGGGMDMAGQVNLVLRGSDLVGSINRTNAQISRTG